MPRISLLFSPRSASAFKTLRSRCLGSGSSNSGNPPPAPLSAEATDVSASSVSAVTSVAEAASTPANLTTQRTVYISSAARSAMQAGQLHEGVWRIDFDVQSRWENPLMGWTSSRDPMQGMVLKFPTRDAAVHFAQRQGWQWQVIQPQAASWKPKSYADNFAYSSGPLKFVRTK